MSWFSDLWDRLVVNYQSTITGLVVLVFTWASDHGIDVSQDNQKVATAKVLAIALSLIKLFGKDSPKPPDTPSTGGVAVLILLCLVLLPLSQSACWGGKGTTATRKVIEQLDNNAIAAREIPTALMELLNLKLIQAQTARSFGSKSEAFRAANRQLVEFFDSPEFKTVDAEGRAVITMTPAGKVKAEELVKSLVEAARAIVADKALFSGLSDSTRASLSALFSAAGNTADSMIKLVQALRASQGKATTIVIPADEWRQLQHAKEVAAYGF